MSSIEALKEQARTHEQKEEWGKALETYKKAIDQLAADEQPDIGLYNRVADIQVRQGRIEDGVGNYEKAIDLYIEKEFPNNAIAVCKKIVRNMPMWHTIYLRMGQIRGKQGSLTDARQNFLTYAERMQAEGKIDEGLRALGELADLAPEDVDIRLAIAAQIQQHGRTDDAIVQLQAGYRQATQSAMPTAPFEKMLAQLGAEPDLSATADLVGELSADTGIGQFGNIELGAAVPEEGREEAEFEVGGFQIAGETAADQEEGEGGGGGERGSPPVAGQRRRGSLDAASPAG